MSETVNFKDLLSKPADQVKRPPVLPAGLYIGTIKQREFGQTKSDKKTPYVRFQVALSGPGEGHDDGAFTDIQVAGKTLRKDYYLTPDAEFRLVEAAKGMGIDVSGLSLAQVIEEMLNRQVIVVVTARPMQPRPGDAPDKEPEFINEIADLKALA